MKMLQALSVFLVVVAGGCGDSLDNILRDARNRKNEIIEILLKIDTEEEAKIAKKTTLDKAKKDFDEIIRARVELWEKTQKLEDIFNRINSLLRKDGADRFDVRNPNREALDRVLGKIDANNKALVLPVYEAMIAYAKDEEASAARLVKAGFRLNQIVERLKLAKEEELRNQGDANPVIDEKEHWPNLIALQDVNFYSRVTVKLAGFYTGGGPKAGAMPGDGAGGPVMPGGPK